MGKIQYILKDACFLILKLAAIILVVWGIFWLMQKGAVIVDQGKKHGLLQR